MNRLTGFLRRKADQLRELASISPEIAAQLRLLADEVDAEASEFERRGDQLGEAARQP